MTNLETKCAAFWHITSVRSDSTVHPCCRFKTPVLNFDGNLDNVLQSKAYQDLREKSSNNEYIEGCEKCYLEEKLGKKSYRNIYNEEYGTDEIALKFIDIAFDNICNLTCDGCWGEFSSSWKEKENPGQPKKNHIVQIHDIVNIPDTLEKIWFLGGEPLMTNRHKRFIKKIKNINQVEICYNTNGTYLFDQETIEYLKKSKKTLINVSIDGFKELNEKVRSGSLWNNILEFIDQLSSNNLDFNIHTVIHKNNWFGIDDLEKFIRCNNYSWTTNVLTYPKHLSVKNLNLLEKQQFDFYLENSTVPNKSYVKEFMYSDSSGKL